MLSVGLPPGQRLCPAQIGALALPACPARLQSHLQHLPKLVSWMLKAASSPVSSLAHQNAEALMHSPNLLEGRDTSFTSASIWHWSMFVTFTAVEASHCGDGVLCTVPGAVVAGATAQLC